jgi:hypothetical protein
MNHDSANSLGQPSLKIAAICILAVLAVPVWLMWCRINDAPTPDNSLSIEGALSIAGGDGYVRHWFTPGDDILSSPSTRHITEFPPGVSLILLPFVAAGLEGNIVLKSLEFTAILVGGIFWVRYLREHNISSISQLCLAALIGFNCTPHRIGTTFSDAIIWTVFPLWLSDWKGLMHHDANSRTRSFSVALLTTLMVLIRYQCVVFIAVNTAIVLTSGKKRYAALFCTIALPLLAFGGNLLWNKAQTGATSYVTDVAATTTHNWQSVIHPSPVEALASRPLGLNWFTSRVLQSLPIADQQRNYLRLLAAAVIASLAFYCGRNTFRGLLRNPLALTYLATLGLLAVLTIQDSGIRPGWTFIEDERYYLFLYPAFAIQTGIAILAVSRRLQAGLLLLTLMILITLGSGLRCIRYCHGVWSDSTQPNPSLYRVLSNRESLPKRTIVIGNEQVLRALPIEAYPRTNEILSSLVSDGARTGAEESGAHAAVIIPIETEQFDLEDEVAEALRLTEYANDFAGSTRKVYSSTPLNRVGPSVRQ